MGDVVNLNKFRKRKAKEEAAKRADANRRKHGQTRADREQVERKKQLLESKLDQVKLEPPPPPPTDDSPEGEAD